jgi:hypothetical protein
MVDPQPTIVDHSTIPVGHGLRRIQDLIHHRLDESEGAWCSWDRSKRCRVFPSQNNCGARLNLNGPLHVHMPSALDSHNTRASGNRQR